MSKKVNDALKKYYSTLGYDTGVKAFKRGGNIGFAPSKFTDGGDLLHDPESLYGLYLRGQYGYGKLENPTVITPESTQTLAGGTTLRTPKKSEFDWSSMLEGDQGQSSLPLGKNVNMSTPWSAIAGTAGALTVDLQRLIDAQIRKNDSHVYNPLVSAGLAKGGRKFEGGGFSSSPMDIAGSAVKIAANAVNQASLTTDYDVFQDAVNRYTANQISSINGITDNDSLMNAYANMYQLSDNIKGRDFRDKTVLGDITDGLASSFEGFNATGNWIGAVVGGVSSNIGSIIGRIRANKAANRAEELVRKRNQEIDTRLFHASQDVDRRNDTMRMLGYYNDPFEYAYGGEMRTHGSDWNNGLTFINEGGRHEDNPYEGVPSGVDADGIPNLVEEGEVIWNDEYVFSDRLKVPETLSKKYKLGGEKTFAEAIKEVTKESLTRPNDPISNETNRAIVNEFMDAQEALREKEQAKAARQVQTAYDEDFMNQLAALSSQGEVPVQEGLQLPPQGMSEEGMPIEGAPAGFALGGNKFDDGSWKRYYTTERDENGNLVYVAPDGMRQYSEAGARKYAELNSDSWIVPTYVTTVYPVIRSTNARGAVVGGGSRGNSGYVETSGGTGASGTTSGGGSRGKTVLPNGLVEVRSQGRNGNIGPVHHYETSDGRNVGNDLSRANAIQERINNSRDTTQVSNTSPANPVNAEPTGNVYDRDFVSRFSGEYTPFSEWQMPEVSPGVPRQSAPATSSSGYARGSRSNTKYDRTKLDPIVDGYLKTFYREGSPVYKEKKAEALRAQNARWDAAKSREAEGISAQEAFQQEQAAQIQRMEAAKQYKHDRGYGMFTPMSSEDRAVFDDILSGTRDTSGNLTSTSQAQPTPAGAMRRYATSSFDRALSAGYVPTATSALPDEEASQETPQSSVTVKEEDIRFKNDQTKKAASNYLKSKGVPNYSDLTDSQKAEYIRIASGTQGTRRTGNAGGGNAGTGLRSDIDYNRKLSAKESRDWEARKEYQDFLKYMRSNPNSPEAKQWMDYIQSEIKNSGSSYTLKDFDNWSKLAEDGKVGPVHQATLLAAQKYAEKQNAPQPEGPVQAPQSGNTVAPSNSKDFIDSLNAAIEATRGTQQGTAEAPRTRPATPNFEYEPTWQRMAPVYGAGAMALYGMLGRPNYENADAIIEAARAAGVPVNIPVQTIGDYRVRKPYDERYLVNMANQNRAAGQRSIYNTSGGNRAMDMLGAMNLAYNNQLDLGEIMRQAYLANRQDDAQVAEFNRGTNIQNMNAINQRNLAQAQLNSQRQATALSGISRGYGVRQGIKDSWDAATMQSINSLLTSLGAIGKENEENNILKSMAKQGYFPYYYGDRSVLQNVPRTVSKNGGNKLNKKKRRF